MDSSASVPSIPLQKSYSPLKVLPPAKKQLFKQLAIDTMEEVRFIAFDDIVYCKSSSNYTTVFVQGGKSYLCCKILKEVEARLPADQFLRIHQSYLVNLHFITALKKQSGELEIDNRLLLPISPGQRKELYRLFNL